MRLESEHAPFVFGGRLIPYPVVKNDEIRGQDTSLCCR
jgi:hypothetical protein